MGAGGQPGSGDSASWLQYLSQMFGISPQQAATMMQSGAPNPANMPSPDAQNVNMVDLSSAANGPAAPSPIMSAQAQPSAGPPVGASLLDQSGVQRGPMGILRTQPGASAPVGASLLDQSGVARSPAGILTPGGPAGTGPAPPVAAPAARVPGPMASGGAGGNAATSNPRFVGIEAPNFSPQNSMRGGPQGTALNLAGLFGRGGGAPSGDRKSVV